jgi:hypothetical protein
MLSTSGMQLRLDSYVKKRPLIKGSVQALVNGSWVMIFSTIVSAKSKFEDSSEMHGRERENSAERRGPKSVQRGCGLLHGRFRIDLEHMKLEASTNAIGT